MITRFCYILLLAGIIFFSYKKMITDEKLGKGFIYRPVLPGTLLPAFFLILILIIAHNVPFKDIPLLVFLLCFNIFVHMGMYFILLALLLPFLRKYVNPRACAILWLLPNYLYLTTVSIVTLTEPLLIVPIPKKFLELFAYVWIIGFGLIFLWNILSHLSYRRRILKDAVPVTEARIYSILNKERIQSGDAYTKYKIVWSPQVESPLSIGLFKRTMRIVLPQKDYTEEELSMIIRHELIHICREDCWSKFFFLFCKAVCWFNPFTGYAMKKSSEDLELSCDEMVLRDESEENRKNYARLILNTAGHQQGFTTCLSASASALRYRLENILTQRKRYSGGLVIVLFFVCLYMSCDLVAFSYEAGTGHEIIFESKTTEDYHLASVFISDAHSYSSHICKDPDFLFDYLSDLKLEKLSGSYTNYEKEHSIYFGYDTPEGRITVILSDHRLKIHWLDLDISKTYYLKEQTDWNRIHQTLSPN